MTRFVSTNRRFWPVAEREHCSFSASKDAVHDHNSASADIMIATYPVWANDNIDAVAN